MVCELVDFLQRGRSANSLALNSRTAVPVDLKLTVIVVLGSNSTAEMLRIISML
jgi:hypothetical protein